jgi:hypothetical protein
MARGPAWPARRLDRRTASKVAKIEQPRFDSAAAFGDAEESTVPVFQKTGPDVCCRRLPKS